MRATRRARSRERRVEKTRSWKRCSVTSSNSMARITSLESETAPWRLNQVLLPEPGRPMASTTMPVLRRGWGAGAAAGAVGPTACAGRPPEAVPLPPCQPVREAAPTRSAQGRRAAAVPPGRRLPNSAAPPRCPRRPRFLPAGRWGTAPPPAGSAGTAAGSGASTGWAGQDYRHWRHPPGDSGWPLPISTDPYFRGTFSP